MVFSQQANIVFEFQKKIKLNKKVQLYGTPMKEDRVCKRVERALVVVHC